jgi:hypothetical protein
LREHFAEEHRALGPIEMERLVAVLCGRVVGQLAETEYGLRPRLYGLLEEVAQVCDRERTREALLRRGLGGCLGDAERGAQLVLRIVGEQGEQAVFVGNRVAVRA